jgi:hypothetical protein
MRDEGLTHYIWHDVLSHPFFQFNWKSWNMVRIYFHFFQSKMRIKEKRFTIIIFVYDICIVRCIVYIVYTSMWYCLNTFTVMATMKTILMYPLTDDITHCVILPVVLLTNRTHIWLFRYVLYTFRRLTQSPLIRESRLIYFIVLKFKAIPQRYIRGRLWNHNRHL